MNNQEELKILIDRYHQGKCSPEELERLRVILLDPQQQALLDEVYELLSDDNSAEQLLRNRKKEIYEQLLRDPRMDLVAKSSKETKVFRMGRWSWWAAGVILFMISIPFLYRLVSSDQSQTPDSIVQDLDHSILPGENLAQIILDDGSIVDLGNIMGDTVINLDGFSILKTADGSISYQFDNSNLSANTLAHNTIVTPRGGQYKMTLPDGTQVWLNAQSSLRYPVIFDENIRYVELTGEAYFDVTTTKKGGKSVPFIVQTGNQRLEVLGTQFNVHGYNEDIKTTLVEGKVRLKTLDGDRSVILHPDQQAVLRQDFQGFRVSQVDPLHAAAWKNGNFSFQRASIREVMESIARWYDVEVAYNGSFNNHFFTGTISRYEQIDKLLGIIELTGNIQFKIEGRRVMVTD